jgi:hypothetical protein
VTLGHPKEPLPVTDIRVDWRVPVRQRVGRLLDLLVGDWWAPNRRVAAAVLLVILGLLVLIGFTLGPTVAVLVVAAGAAMRIGCPYS